MGRCCGQMDRPCPACCHRYLESHRRLCQRRPEPHDHRQAQPRQLGRPPLTNMPRCRQRASGVTGIPCSAASRAASSVVAVAPKAWAKTKNGVALHQLLEQVQSRSGGMGGLGSRRVAGGHKPPSQRNTSPERATWIEWLPPIAGYPTLTSAAIVKSVNHSRYAFFPNNSIFSLRNPILLSFGIGANHQ